MDITTYFQGSLQLKQDGLLEEQLPGLETEPSHLSLSHLHRLAGSAPTDFEEPLDDVIDVDLPLGHGWCLCRDFLLPTDESDIREMRTSEGCAASHRNGVELAVSSERG